MNHGTIEAARSLSFLSLRRLANRRARVGMSDPLILTARNPAFARHAPLTPSRGAAVDVAADIATCYQTRAMGRGGLKGSALAQAALAHMDALYRVACRLTHSSVAAEDLVQETYARALGSVHSFEVNSNLRAWLFKILRNAHIDATRRQRRSPMAPEIDDEFALVAPDPLRGDQELDWLKRVVSSDIERALQTLPGDASTIILLDLEGFTETELSEVLGCPLGTVKSRLARARLALRKVLGDYAR